MILFPLVTRQQGGEGSGDGPTESRADDVLIILITMQIFSTMILILRICTRIFVQHLRLGADDWTILVSWLFLVAFTVDVCVQTEYGLGQHLRDLPPDTNHAAALELFYYGEALYYITASMTKVSILCLYLKLFPQPNYRIATWTMMGFVIATCVACTIAGIFQCDPIYRAWETTVPGTCFNQVGLFLANAGLNILQDLIIYVLPAPMLWKIQLPLKQRIALIFVFVVGGFVVVTGILRLDGLRMASVSHDPTWDNYSAAIWSSIEANFGIVCASLVHFKALIARFAPSMLSLSRQSRGTNMMRLGDDPSTAGGKGSLQTFGARQGKSSKPFGILTEMELEDTVTQSQSDLIPPNRGTATATVSHGQESSSENDEDRPGVIHTTKHFSVSYKDAN